MSESVVSVRDAAIPRPKGEMDRALTEGAGWERAMARGEKVGRWKDLARGRREEGEGAWAWRKDVKRVGLKDIVEVLELGRWNEIYRETERTVTIVLVIDPVDHPKGSMTQRAHTTGHPRIPCMLFA